MRLAISGGAPIAKDTQKFLNTCVCPVIQGLLSITQGYGMTETCGLISVQRKEDYLQIGSVGSVAPSTEMKLVSFDNYDATAAIPEGEIWVRGNGITSGYYNQDKVTKDTITADGWLRTGWCLI